MEICFSIPVLKLSEFLRSLNPNCFYLIEFFFRPEKPFAGRTHFFRNPFGLMLSSLDIIFPKIFSSPSSTKVFQEFGHTFVSYIFGLENKLSFHNIF